MGTTGNVVYVALLCTIGTLRAETPLMAFYALGVVGLVKVWEAWSRMYRLSPFL